MGNITISEAELQDIKRDVSLAAIDMCTSDSTRIMSMLLARWHKLEGHDGAKDHYVKIARDANRRNMKAKENLYSVIARKYRP